MSVPWICSESMASAPSERRRDTASSRKAASPQDGSKMVSLRARTAHWTRNLAIGCGVKNAPRAFRAWVSASKGLIARAIWWVDYTAMMTERVNPLEGRLALGHGVVAWSWRRRGTAK